MVLDGWGATTFGGFVGARSALAAARASLGPNPLFSADRSHSRVFEKKKKHPEQHLLRHKPYFCENVGRRRFHQKTRTILFCSHLSFFSVASSSAPPKKSMDHRLLTLWKVKAREEGQKWPKFIMWYEHRENKGARKWAKFNVGQNRTSLSMPGLVCWFHLPPPPRPPPPRSWLV